MQSLQSPSAQWCYPHHPGKVFLRGWFSPVMTWAIENAAFKDRTLFENGPMLANTVQFLGGKFNWNHKLQRKGSGFFVNDVNCYRVLFLQCGPEFFLQLVAWIRLLSQKGFNFTPCQLVVKTSVQGAFLCLCSIEKPSCLFNFLKPP
jgi:hypothetical protein